MLMLKPSRSDTSKGVLQEKIRLLSQLILQIESLKVLEIGDGRVQ